MIARLTWIWLFLITISGVARAHETDQFEVPPDRKFADLGDYFNRWAYEAIRRGVDVSNARVRHAMAPSGAGERLDLLQSPTQVTMAVRDQWPWSVTQIETFETLLRSPAMRERYPGRLVAYGQRVTGVYEFAFLPLDIRMFAHILFFSSTIKVNGTYLGTDKLGHFTDEGISYYFAYREARDAGADERTAIAHAVLIGTDGLMSERGLLGSLANADYSNGDLAANFLGFLFYRNLTEPVVLKGRLYGPMLLRDGVYWKLADDVRPDSGFFARFISDHLDEALNPGFFDTYLRPGLRLGVRMRTRTILQHYVDEHGTPHTKEWFDQKLEDLRTYWGVDYGHLGTYDELVSIGGECFDPLPRPTPNMPGEARSAYVAAWVAPGADSVARQPPATTRSDGRSEAVPMMLVHSGAGAQHSEDFGQSALHQAAAAGHVKQIPELLRSGESIDERDDFGRTPLHEAARAGAADTARALLDDGAHPNATDDYGNTPMHLACRRGNLATVRLLLAHGADVNTRTHAGNTPLHEAAFAGDPDICRLLLAHGANSAVHDRMARTPADIALERGHPELVMLLRTRRPLAGAAR